MLPVVRGERETLRQIVAYTLVLIAVTLLPVASGTAGVAYAVGALALGLTFLFLTLRLRRNPSRPGAALLFHYSLLYLALLFVVMAVDVL
jgi:protoheme IX farnesyltransferase